MVVFFRIHTFFLKKGILCTCTPLPQNRCIFKPFLMKIFFFKTWGSTIFAPKKGPERIVHGYGAGVLLFGDLYLWCKSGKFPRVAKNNPFFCVYRIHILVSMFLSINDASRAVKFKGKKCMTMNFSQKIHLV